MDRRYQERYESQFDNLKIALDSMNRRLDLLNELRSGVATRDQLDALEKEMNTITSRLERAEGRSSGVGMMWGALGIVAGLVIAVVSWATR